jgi:hypothetical protein
MICLLVKEHTVRSVVVHLKSGKPLSSPLWGCGKK